jgi:small subunit ribosomal protein S20
MPIIKSAIKRARQSIKRRSHNLQVKRLVNADIKAVHTAIEAGDSTEIKTSLSAAYSEIDRAVKKGTLHKNTAARRKSQLAGHVAKVEAKPEVVEEKAKKAPTKSTAAKKTTAKKPVAKKAPPKTTKKSA